MSIQINASIFDFMPLDISASEHINEMKFTGCLVTLDGPSSKAPNGSQGKKIWMPSKVAARRLHTLIGMGLNYKPELDGHAPRRKVGVIQKAWIDGKNLMVSGIIWKKDFPEAEKDLKNRKDLGMSFEASDISVEDPNAPMWKLTDFTFTGGTILHKKDAAYFATSAIAAQAAVLDAASQIKKIQGGNSMATKEKEKHAAKASKKVHASSGSETDKLIHTMTKAVVAQTAMFKSIMASNQELKASIEASNKAASEEEEQDSIEASAESEEEVDSVEAGAMTEPMVKAKAGGFSMSKGKGKKFSSSSSESMSSSESVEASAEDASLEKLGEEDTSDDDKPGHLNKNTKQKGDQTTVENDHANNKTVSASSFKKMQKQLARLEASGEQDKVTIKKLQKQVKRQEVALQASADKQDRKSLTPMSMNLLTKGGVDPYSLHASGHKLSVEEVDGILAAGGADLSITQRMSIKTELARAGYMDEGLVSRVN